MDSELLGVGGEVGEGSVVHRKIRVVIHVSVDEPDTLQWDSSVGVPLDVLLEGGHVLVVASPEEACHPRAQKGGSDGNPIRSDHALVVSDDLLGGALEEEEDLEVASSSDVTQSASTFLNLMLFHRHR